MPAPPTPHVDLPPPDWDAGHPLAGRRWRWIGVALTAVVLAAAGFLLLRGPGTGGGSSLFEPETEAVEPVALQGMAVADGLGPGDAEEDGRYVDAYSFTTDTEDPVTITVAGAFEPRLLVRLPDGRRVGGIAVWEDPLVTEAAGLRVKGRYVVTVSSRPAGARGRYVLRVQERPAVEVVVDGPPRAGALGDDPALRDGRYEARFAVEADRGRPYTLVLESDSALTTLFVEDPEGDSLATAAVAAVRTVRGTQAVLARFTPDEGGRYVVVARSLEPGVAGHYTARLRAGNGVELPLASGDIVDAVLGAEPSALRDGGYVDAYAFAGRAGQRATADVTGRGFVPTLTLVGPGGPPATATATGSNGRSVHLERVLPADGRYRLEVSGGTGATGAYTLTFGPPPAPRPRPPAPRVDSTKLQSEKEPG